jgi:multidrug efflux pump subunit AcrA (membrane-fusion protein)
MGAMNQTISNVNTTLRTLLMLALVGGAGVGGYKAYEVYNKPQRQLASTQEELKQTRGNLQKAQASLAAEQQKNAELASQNAEQAATIERQQIAMQLLKVRRRLARLTVLDQRERTEEDATPVAGETENEVPKNLVTRIEFVEINDGGDPIGEAKEFEIVGDMVYVDYLRVTFDDKYIEESDLDRSTAICLFQRIFGEYQDPAEGFHLDTVGTRPTAYARGTEMSDFERKIWNDFWLIANDSRRAAELGIHAAHGNAVSIRVKPNQTYEIDLRSTGEMSIRPAGRESPAAASAD